jgi:hypothetical protein
MAHKIVESTSGGGKYCEKCGATENFIRRCPNDTDLIIERKRLELDMLRHSGNTEYSFLGHTGISTFSVVGKFLTIHSEQQISHMSYVQADSAHCYCYLHSLS